MQPDGPAQQYICAYCPGQMDGRPIEILSPSPLSWAHRSCIATRQNLQRLDAADVAEPDYEWLDRPDVVKAGPIEVSESREVIIDPLLSMGTHVIEPADDPLPLVPEGGFAPGDFPTMIVEPLRYVTAVGMRPDPMMSATKSLSIIVDVGPVRLGFPTRADWEKFYAMGTRLLNTQERTNTEEEVADVPAADDREQ